jgi:Transposase DDE domain
MNQGKVGAPFEYSHSYIHFLAFLKIGFKIAYRTVQGITRGLSDYIRIEEMHFTHIRRWILNIKPSVRITKGNIHDTKKFGQLVKESAGRYNVDKVYGDKAYDNRKNFNLLDDINAEPAISIRKNASSRSKGCPLRRDEVLLIKKLGYDGWKQLKDTGRRWIAEVVFSSLKRVLGEDLLSKKFKAQKVEAGFKVMLYNKFISQ